MVRSTNHDERTNFVVWIFVERMKKKNNKEIILLLGSKMVLNNIYAKSLGKITYTKICSFETTS